MTCLGLLVVGESKMRQGRDLMGNLFCARFSFLVFSFPNITRGRHAHEWVDKWMD